MEKAEKNKQECLEIVKLLLINLSILCYKTIYVSKNGREREMANKNGREKFKKQKRQSVSVWKYEKQFGSQER